MNETLTVRDFGPIREAEVTFKRVTVFIGPTGGGKSTLAKLAAVWKNKETVTLTDDKSDQALANFNLANYYHIGSSTKWVNSKGVSLPWEGKEVSKDAPVSINQVAEMLLRDKHLSDSIVDDIVKRLKQTGVDNYSDKSFKEQVRTTLAPQFLAHSLQKDLFPSSPAYIPSERVFYGAISFSLAGMMRDDINLPKPLLEFVNDFASAKKEITDLELPLFDVKYEQRGGDDYIRIPGREKPLYLYETASGIQSVAPLLVLLEHLSRQTKRPQSFIIEEPELNLYPEAQQALLNVLIEKCAKADGKNDLIITTHSPYILASCNVLLEAWKVWEKRPDLEKEIEAIVPRASWINPAEFAAYYVADGTVKPITDERTHLLGANELDAVSGDISDAFRKLLRLSKQQPTADA